MTDLNINLNVPALEKLVDYTASGVGAIAGPLLAPWRASREGEAKLTAVKADAEVRRIEAESGAQSLVIIADAQAKARQSFDTPIESERGMIEISRDNITQKIEFQERKRLANVRSVVTYSAEELHGRDVQNHDPDPDWTARFFDSVQDVSSEDMQKIWARILSGEVENPGRTSLRTLDTLRNMTKRDAEMFSDACSFVFREGEMYFILQRIPDEYDALRHTKLLHLQDCGLIFIGPTAYHTSDEATSKLVYQSLLLQISRNTKAHSRFEISISTLTTAGAELYRISEPQLRMDYLRVFAGILHSNKYQLSSAQIVNQHSDGRLEHRNEFTPIEPESQQVGGAAR